MLKGLCTVLVVAIIVITAFAFIMQVVSTMDDGSLGAFSDMVSHVQEKTDVLGEQVSQTIEKYNMLKTTSLTGGSMTVGKVSADEAAGPQLSPPQPLYVSSEADSITITTQHTDITDNLRIDNIASVARANGTVAITGTVVNTSRQIVSFIDIQASLYTTAEPDQPSFISVRGYDVELKPGKTLDVEIIVSPQSNYDSYDLSVIDCQIAVSN